MARKSTGIPNDGNGLWHPGFPVTLCAIGFGRAIHSVAEDKTKNEKKNEREEEREEEGVETKYITRPRINECIVRCPGLSFSSFLFLLSYDCARQGIRVK